MRRFERDGLDHIEYRNSECSDLKIAPDLVRRLACEYLRSELQWTGIVSALDATTSTMWTIAVDRSVVYDVTAVTGMPESPAHVVRIRPESRLSGDTA